jgi:type II secretory pathway pseudopilin PulG
MRERSKSTLFLIEQIIVIAVFAVCAAVCVKILTVSFLMTENAVDTRNALAVAESAAESFKAFNGDVERVFEIMSGDVDGFNLYIDVREEMYVLFADIKVTKIDTDNELVSLTVAVRRGE